MTHIENIQNFGNKLVENLNTMGIEASFNDGALTLADKILDINKITTALTLQGSNINVNDSINLSGTLSCKITDDYIDITEPMGNASIKIYNGNTLLGTVTTNSNGEYTFTKQITSAQTLNLKSTFEKTSKYKQGQATKTITVSKISPTLSMSLDKSNYIIYGDTLTFSGTFSGGSGKTLTLYQNNVSIGTIQTGTNGAFSKTIYTTENDVGDNTYYVKFNGDNIYNTVQSANKTIKIINKNVDIGDISYTKGQQSKHTFSCTIKNKAGDPISGIPVTIHFTSYVEGYGNIDSFINDDAITNSNGKIDATLNFSANIVKWRMVFNGNDTYNAFDVSFT